MSFFGYTDAFRNDDRAVEVQAVDSIKFLRRNDIPVKIFERRFFIHDLGHQQVVIAEDIRRSLSGAGILLPAQWKKCNRT